MPYILNKSNGQQLTVVQDGSIDASSTSLTFPGKNYAGYGQILDQNLAKLLENFAHTVAPTKPLTGQLWYDAGTKNLKVYNGSRFRSVQKFDSGSAKPSDVTKGDLWFNDSDQKLYLFNGQNFVMIGPQNSTFSGVQLVPVIAQDNTTLVGGPRYVMEFDITDGNGIQSIPVVVAKDSFTPNPTDNLINQGFTGIYTGITLQGAGPLTSRGVSYPTSLIWGTASSALGLWDRNASTYRDPSDFLLATQYQSDLSTGLNVTNDAGLNVNNVIRIHADTANTEGKISAIGGNKITIALRKASNGILTDVLQFNQNDIIPETNNWTINLGNTVAGFGFGYINTLTSSVIISTGTILANVVSATTFVGAFQGNVAGNVSTTGTITAGTVHANSFLGTLTGVTIGDVFTYNISVPNRDPFTHGLITGAWKLSNQSTLEATYADIAERYEADAVYEPGTVLVIGGDKEVTTTDQFADTRVAGIVSNNPAYMMNSDAGNDETHPYIALKGRVPCKVVGYIKKGDLLVTSTHPGYATAVNAVHSGAIIGKALEGNSEGFGIIEVKV